VYQQNRFERAAIVSVSIVLGGKLLAECPLCVIKRGGIHGTAAAGTIREKDRISISKAVT
jgi:hypothetical protein